MKFSCTQENFNQGLLIASHIATKNVNLPILNNILIKAEDGLIKISTTNLEIGVTCFVRGKVEENGEFTLPARVLADYINLLPREKIDLELKEDQIKINCSNHQTTIKGEAASEFPLIPQIKKTIPYSIKPNEFLRGIQQVVFATAISEARPEISGVFMYFDNENKKLIMAATDSYRLAEKKINLSKISEENKEKKVVLPTKTLQEIQRILSVINKEKDNDGGEEDFLDIYLNENQILFVYNNIELISRVIEGQYPNYSAIIPNSYKTQMIIHTDDLTKAVKSASLFVKSGINDISLQLKPEAELIISSINAQIGENTSSLEANINGEQNEVVLNYRYLLDGLTAINTSEALVEVTDNNTPVIIKPVLASAQEGVDRDYLYLIMPIKQ
ncbi:MAG: DNA polymerase III subunit beta [Patescibacteria group bacterium]|jgi:DNA polymerase-3 subunit beta